MLSETFINSQFSVSDQFSDKMSFFKIRFLVWTDFTALVKSLNTNIGSWYSKVLHKPFLLETSNSWFSSIIDEFESA
jgi:hypothetical protein